MAPPSIIDNRSNPIRAHMSYLPSPPPSAAKNKAVAALARKHKAGDSQIPTPKNAPPPSSVFTLSPPEDDPPSTTGRSPKPVPELAVEHALFHKRGDTHFLSPCAPSPRKPTSAAPPPPPSKGGTPNGHFGRGARAPYVSPIAQKIPTGQPGSATLSPYYNPTAGRTYLEQCFEVLGKIGQGSFSEVYRVRAHDDGVLYAVKRTNRQFRGLADRDSKLGEVAAVRSLRGHPNCVSYVDAWEEHGYLYIQMELCDRSLKEYSESYQSLDEDELWDFLADIASGLKHVHSHDLVHCDIKPANIFLGEDHTLKIGDFGISLHSKSSSSGDEKGEGDAMYLAPEVLEGHVGAPADIFSLGLTMLEIAANVDLPKNGVMWHRLRNREVPHDLLADVSTELAELILRMMEPDPHMRPTVDDILSHPIVASHAARRRRLRFLRNLRDGFLYVFVALWHRLCLCIVAVAKWLSRQFQSPPATPDSDNELSTVTAMGQRAKWAERSRPTVASPTLRHYESEHEDASGNDSDPGSPTALRRQSLASAASASVAARPKQREARAASAPIASASPAIVRPSRKHSESPRTSPPGRDAPPTPARKTPPKALFGRKSVPRPGFVASDDEDDYLTPISNERQGDAKNLLNVFDDAAD